MSLSTLVKHREFFLQPEFVYIDNAIVGPEKPYLTELMGSGLLQKVFHPIYPPFPFLPSLPDLKSWMMRPFIPGVGKLS